jgi:Transposase IS200 like
MAHNVASATVTYLGPRPQILAVVAAPPINLHAHLVFVTKYRPGVLDTQMPNRCEHVMAHVCVDFGATWPSSTGT